METPERSEMVQETAPSLEEIDKSRKKKKTARAAASFLVIALLLLILFFAAVNIGSLKVSFGELLRGLFAEFNDDVSTIYDLRFPRIII